MSQSRMKKYGKEAKNARIGAGLTQNDLARLVGVSQACISRIESGTLSPRATVISKMLKLYSKRYNGTVRLFGIG